MISDFVFDLGQVETIKTGSNCDGSHPKWMTYESPRVQSVDVHQKKCPDIYTVDTSLFLERV